MTEIHLDKLLLENTNDWKCKGKGGPFDPIFFYPPAVKCCKISKRGCSHALCMKPITWLMNINTRNKSNLYLPISNLAVYQKGTYYTGIRVFNSLPSQIKELYHNRNQFKRALKIFLYFHSFYTLVEYFSYNKI